ncbi:oxidoreductase [Olivibacter sp. SDN3]|uniref:putative oxidoreductase C-terminal domain-containing protein n=1 Tax=Olivibacter sp. SDN3 TaxID=2764720 RepID=UPI00165128E6|nr:putative oxidoreductase C-terminal domain-containing protein [Olivibacter sp. SDN3]QNL50588.1 oxidoreductase [Olivibacter sp. SDN3]
MITKSKFITTASLLVGLMMTACNNQEKEEDSRQDEQISLITLDPGHFHAALVQKSMYPGVNSTVQAYAPAEDNDLKAHLNLIEGYNNDATNPTHWKEEVYTGDDFLAKMLEDRKGNVVVLAGNNKRKIDYINQSIDAGLNVLADKPMAIDEEGFGELEKSFAEAKEKGVLLYDIMTERFEITATLQKEFSQIESLFGTLEKGSLAEPAITKESVHHFFKTVSGKPLIRPTWFFDVSQQGEGIVDVTTHLVDLVQWEGFPDQVINYEKDIELLNAKRWATWLKADEFKKATNETYPDEFQNNVNDKNELGVYANGEINYTIKGVHAKVLVKWNFEAPEGTGDTHYSIMRGTKANLVIKQGAEENYKPVLYIETSRDGDRDDFNLQVAEAVKALEGKYKGIAVEQLKEGNYKVIIPQELTTSHEEHFAQVTENFLSYLANNKLPDWEVPNMLTKYYITTKALSLAKKEK